MFLPAEAPSECWESVRSDLELLFELDPENPTGRDLLSRIQTGVPEFEVDFLPTRTPDLSFSATPSITPSYTITATATQETTPIPTRTPRPTKTPRPSATQTVSLTATPGPTETPASTPEQKRNGALTVLGALAIFGLGVAVGQMLPRRDPLE